MPQVHFFHNRGSHVVQAVQVRGQDLVAHLQQTGQLSVLRSQLATRRVVEHRHGQIPGPLFGSGDLAGPRPLHQHTRAHQNPNGPVLLLNHPGVQVLTELVDEPVALVPQFVGRATLGLKSLNLPVQLGDVVQKPVYVLHSVHNFIVDGQDLISQVAGGPVEGSDHRLGLFAHHHPRRLVFRIVGELAPGVPELVHRRLQARVAWLVENGFHLGQGFGHGRPPRLLRGALSVLLVQKSVAVPPDPGQIHSCANGSPERAHRGRWNQNGSLPGVARGVDVGNVVADHVGHRLLDHQRLFAQLEDATQGGHRTSFTNRSPANSRAPPTLRLASRDGLPQGRIGCAACCFERPVDRVLFARPNHDVELRHADLAQKLQ